MTLPKTRTTLLLNWYANPYHTPIFVAQANGYFADENISLAILEPTDPGDVTEIVGLGDVDFGLKAMIHTIAARAKGFDVTSIATLLDEPPTGLLMRKSSGINSFQDIVGKRLGYIGEFGKKIIDDLAHLAGIASSHYQTVRVGMNVTDAIKRDIIDAGIGFSNFQKIELQHFDPEINFIRLDELAGLGCCCFCSILYITSAPTLMQQPKLVKSFLSATQRGVNFMIEHPLDAFEILCQHKPNLRTTMYRDIFIHTLPYFSRTQINVSKDWDKVNRYTQHLKITDDHFDHTTCYTNNFLPETLPSSQQPIACCV